MEDRFGPLFGLDALAQGNILNYMPILDMDAETTLTKLRMEAARSAYQRRYSKAITQKKDS